MGSEILCLALGLVDEGGSMPTGNSRAAGAPLAGLLLSLLAGLGMLGFAGVLLAGGCGPCASSLPPSLVGAAGVAWTAVAALHRSRWSASGAALLASTHAFLILFLSARPCAVCLAFLAVEFLAVLALGAIHLREAAPTQRLALGSAALLAVGLGAGMAGLLYRDSASRPPVVLRSRGRGDLKTYIIVRRNCRACEEAERRLGQALEEGLPASEAIIVEEGSELGARFVKTLELDTFPAFVAMRHGSVIRAQSGGSVETFVRSLAP
jgi:hypothetical protein